MANGGVYFLTGLAAGVAVGILFAPNSGVETRGLIGRKAEEGKEALKDKASRLQKQAKQMRNRADDLVEQGKEAFTDEKERLEYAVDSGVSAYKSGPRSSSQNS
jgi:gas vesicle protein